MQTRRFAAAGTWLGAVVAVAILAFTAVGAHAFDAKLVCELQNGRKVRVDPALCRALAATASPAPTGTPSPSVKPTLVPDCSDGSFSKRAGRGEALWLGSEERPFIFEPGRVYKLCMTVPAAATARAGIMEFGSANKGNASCGIHHVWLVSPTGRDGHDYGPAPGPRPMFERGKWSVLVMLENNPETLCAENKGLYIWASWY